MRKITLTDKHQELLFQIPLFRDLPLNIKHSLLDRLDISLYSVDKKDIIATQGTLCKKLYVLLEGKLRVDIIDGLGNEVMIEYIVAARALLLIYSVQTECCRQPLLPWKTVPYSLPVKSPCLSLSARNLKYYTTFFASRAIVMSAQYPA